MSLPQRLQSHWQWMGNRRVPTLSAEVIHTCHKSGISWKNPREMPVMLRAITHFWFKLAIKIWFVEIEAGFNPRIVRRLFNYILHISSLCFLHFREKWNAVTHTHCLTFSASFWCYPGLIKKPLFFFLNELRGSSCWTQLIRLAADI